MKYLRVLLCVVFVLMMSVPAYAAVAPLAEEPPPDDGGTVSGILDGLVSLFVPESGYFDSYFNELRSAVDAKTGSIGTIAGKMDNLFSEGYAGCTIEPWRIPDNFLFDGFKGFTVKLIDSSFTPLIQMINLMINATVCIVTFFCCYRSVRELFSGE